MVMKVTSEFCSFGFLMLSSLIFEFIFYIVTWRFNLIHLLVVIYFSAPFVKETVLSPIGWFYHPYWKSMDHKYLGLFMDSQYYSIDPLCLS